MGNEQYLPEDYEHDITGRISDFYGIHINAMTRENLRSKSHIAWELARRDLKIEALESALREIVEAEGNFRRAAFSKHLSPREHAELGAEVNKAIDAASRLLEEK